jgi:hypothetical protein
MNVVIGRPATTLRDDVPDDRQKASGGKKKAAIETAVVPITLPQMPTESLPFAINVLLQSSLNSPEPFLLASTLPGVRGTAAKTSNVTMPVAEPVEPAKEHQTPAPVIENHSTSSSGAVGSAKHPDQIAFAAKIQPLAAAPPSEEPISPASGIARVAVQEKLRPIIQTEGPHSDLVFVAAGDSRLQTMSQMDSDPQPAKVEDVHLSAVQPKDSPRATTPLRDLSVQVSPSSEQRVDVRVMQRAGELHVAVKTGDADLAHGLRQGLPEVVGRLAENGFRADTWHPGASAVAVHAAAETQSSSSSFQQDHQQGQSGSAHRDGGRRDPQHSNRPQWVEEMETSLNQERDGEKSYGLSN